MDKAELQLENLRNELSHLQSATDITGKTARVNTGKKSKSKAPAPPIGQSLDALLASIYELRQKAGDGESVSDEDFQTLAKNVGEKKKDIEERQKEVYASLTRMGKLLDK
ncbi:putative ubiquitin-protein ligase E3, partial [Rhizoctonia solani 123E]